MTATARMPRIEQAGIDAWLVRLFSDIDESNMPWLTALVRRCEEDFGAALIDLVPSYTTVLVHYDPLILSAGEARARLVALLETLSPDSGEAVQDIKELPVWYDPSVGPELERLERHTGWERDKVIELHCEHVYRVFALGFAPGFAFMGSVDERLALPRLETPRRRVPQGSVAIAGRQTSAYPTMSPGGWNLVGRTPAKLFDRQRKGFSLLQVGDQVRFVSVTRQEFERLGGEVTPVEARS
ncbi:5-oxoprolinase subunit PxpB [Litchfieldella xinjiangensis]|uniref:5-oxoprolinase subunit PxpB n=1 Tax=Litchfieldella xinjiangensis TaxID=1166948 RepID=UPI000693CD06|nr:5-oxoprolinase subunit PxpB [Halomonas xinjiangensis]